MKMEIARINMYNFIVEKGNLLYNATKKRKIRLFSKKAIAFYIENVYNTYNNYVIC